METPVIVHEDLTRHPIVSWSAVFAGAAVAASISLILAALGAGLGFASASPWAMEGASAGALGIAAVVWLVLMQVASGGFGAYVAGRMRARWPAVHVDEIYFRDTVHGLLVWAVGTLVTAALLTSAATALVKGTFEAGKATAGAALAVGAAGAAGAAAGSEGNGGGMRSMPAEGSQRMYILDQLFRPAQAGADGASGTSGAATTDTAAASTDGQNTQPTQVMPDTAGSQTSGRNMQNGQSGKSGERDMAARREVSSIFLANLKGDFKPADKDYLTQVVADRTGLDRAEAAKRVTAAIVAVQDAQAKAKQAIDDARSAAAKTSLWVFLSLLVGAFSASWFATCGGRRRDRL